MSDETMRLPRDEFSVLLRELTNNPGATRASSRVEISDFYGRSQTWVIDTFRVDGSETVFMQRMSAEDPLRLVLPPAVTSAQLRQHESLAGQARSRRARQAVATRIARGDTLGNPDALAKARGIPRKRKKRRARKAVTR